MIEAIEVNRRLIKASRFAEIDGAAARSATDDIDKSGEVSVTCNFTRTFLVWILILIGCVIFLFTEGNDTAMHEIANLFDAVKQSEVYKVASTWALQHLAPLLNEIPNLLSPDPGIMKIKPEL